MDQQRAKGLCFDCRKKRYCANFHKKATLAKSKKEYNKGLRKLKRRLTLTQVQLHTTTNKEVYELLDDKEYNNVNDFAN